MEDKVRMVSVRRWFVHARVRPNLGQPESPLTAVDSTASLPFRLSSVRYSPCTCSPMEAVYHQTRKKICLVQSICARIDLPPFQLGDER